MKSTMMIGLSFLCVFTTYGVVRRSSYPYISGDTFRAFCAHIFDETNVPFNPLHVKKADTIFVRLGHLPDFFKIHHDKIPNPYILVSHNSDYSAPGVFKQYLDDPKIIAWFTQNMDTTHPKLFPIPIGFANYYFSHGRTEIVESVIKNTPSAEHSDECLVYLNFQTGSNRAVRQPVWDYFKNKSFCRVSQNKSYQEYLIEMRQCKFVLCPQGNGLDCHRIWEALCLGCIPVMTHLPIDSLFQDLPVILVDDWREITEEFLNQKYEEMSSKNFNKDKIYAQYWFDKIRNIQTKFNSIA